MMLSLEWGLWTNAVYSGFNLLVNHDDNLDGVIRDWGYYLLRVSLGSG